MPLYLVASPLGNLADISARARDTLERADIVAAEDTRRSQKLLRALGVTKPLVSFYEEVEARRAPRLIAALKEGKAVALLSDAGTPCVSDPGYRLVRAAVDAGIEVMAIPGPSAVLAALVSSGLPTDRFRFEGYLPRTDAARRSALEALRHESATTVFFESPKRLVKSLRVLTDLFPERPVVVARELTKVHEELIRGTAAEVVGELEGRERVLGEVTLVVGGGAPPESAREVEIQRVAEILRGEGLSPAVVRRVTAAVLGVSKKAVFEATNQGKVRTEMPPPHPSSD